MATLQISDELAQTIQIEAVDAGLSPEKYLERAVRRERTLAMRRRIEQEQAWWMQQPLRERAKYEGKTVAIYQQTIIDCDEDRNRLAQRIRSRLGNQPVLLIPAEGPREITIYSPHSSSL